MWNTLESKIQMILRWQIIWTKISLPIFSHSHVSKQLPLELWVVQWQPSKIPSSKLTSSAGIWQWNIAKIFSYQIKVNNYIDHRVGVINQTPPPNPSNPDPIRPKNSHRTQIHCLATSSPLSALHRCHSCVMVTFFRRKGNGRIEVRRTNER